MRLHAFTAEAPRHSSLPAGGHGGGWRRRITSSRRLTRCQAAAAWLCERSSHRRQAPAGGAAVLLPIGLPLLSPADPAVVLCLMHDDALLRAWLPFRACTNR